MYLADTNIFLEVLLAQEKKDICKEFLATHQDNLFMSDFSLHSVGVVLFRLHKSELFTRFINDIRDQVGILRLKPEDGLELASLNERWSLDFDDAYQFKIAEMHGLQLVTLDHDFEGVADHGNITFL
ncbi:MAG: PIN domain-containing protein [Candidatus Zixiibacteriota bacterium]|nr:MAG: PIN domain-containing protein [candidate division Zixibacteria bacterium]